jgi:hypothetical protein
MRFAWPTVREAQVEAVRSWEVMGTAVEPKPILRVNYALRVRKVPGGYEAEIADVDLTIGGQRANDQEMAAIAQGLVLFGRIDSRGRFLEFFDFDHLQKSVQAAYREKFKGKTSTSNVEQVIDRATSREVLQSEADRTWEALVGDWGGSDFRVGVPQSKSQTVYIPVLDQSYRLDGRASVSNYERCLPTEAKATCVRLRFSATADPATVKAAIKRGVEGFGQSIDDPGANMADTRFELERLTEPRTLTPYWARWSRAVTITTEVAGVPAATAGKETTTFAFKYLR